MQDNESGNRWVGSDIIWCNSCIVVHESMSVPWGDVMSSDYHDFYRPLKSPKLIVRMV